MWQNELVVVGSLLVENVSVDVCQVVVVASRLCAVTG